MITIFLNGKQLQVNPGSLAQLLQQTGYAESHYAVAVNEQFVPRQQHLHLQINADDQIEVVTPMQGG